MNVFARLELMPKMVVTDLVCNRESFPGGLADAGFYRNDPFLAGLATDQRAVESFRGDFAYSETKLVTERHEVKRVGFHEFRGDIIGELGGGCH